jgi:hypothetical protein
VKESGGAGQKERKREREGGEGEGEERKKEREGGNSTLPLTHMVNEPWLKRLTVVIQTNMLTIMFQRVALCEQLCTQTKSTLFKKIFTTFFLGGGGV